MATIGSSLSHIRLNNKILIRRKKLAIRKRKEIHSIMLSSSPNDLERLGKKKKSKALRIERVTVSQIQIL
jgi:hypothetical protein